MEELNGRGEALELSEAEGRMTFAGETFEGYAVHAL